MERSVIRTVLANTELSSEEKLEQIMALSGADVMREKENSEAMREELAQARGRLLELSDYDDIKKSLEEERQKNSDEGDREALIAERDRLKAERDERLLIARFDSAISGYDIVNGFTREGIKGLFFSAVAEENAKSDSGEVARLSDEQIIKNIIDGHEREYLKTAVSLRMAPHSPESGGMDDIDIIAATKYKGNPWLADDNIKKRV